VKTRPFGRTGLDVSAIGFGCWELGGGYGAFEEDAVVRAVNRAIDLGINCFDTAEGYGRGASERLLARALGSRRKDIILVTKFGIGYKDTPHDKSRDSRRERAMASIESSLLALETDCVDVYLVHWPDVQTPFEETMRALEDIVQQGKARFVGVSNFTSDQVESCLQTRRVDVGQYGYHMFDRRMERDVFPTHERHGIGMMGYGSLGHGLLTGAFGPDTVFDEKDWRSRGGAFNMPLFSEENSPRNLRVVDDLRSIASNRGTTLCHLAIAWVLANPVVSVALVGARTPEEVEANVGAADLALDESDLRAIDEVFARHGVDTRPDVWVE